MVFVPMPADEGVNTPADEFTPGPEYTPPNGTPPLSLKAAALIVVMLSKQRVKETIGAGNVLITILLDEAGLFVTQDRLEVITQRMLSPANGT